MGIVQLQRQKGVDITDGIDCISNLDLIYVKKLMQRMEVVCDEDLQVDHEQLVEIMGQSVRRGGKGIKNSGSIDMYELMVAMVLLSDEEYRDKVECLWSVFDMDQSNSLGFEELIVVAKTVVQTVFSLQDEGEFCQLEDATELARTLLQHYDVNDDQFLAKDEFINLFTQNHRLLQFFFHAGFIAQSDLGDSHQLLKNSVPQIDSDLEIEHTLVNENKLLKEQNQEDKNSNQEQKMINQTASIQLDYILGFNNDLRNAIKYLDNEKIVFLGGNYVVVEDIRERKQSIFQEHQAMVVSFVLVDEQICVSGSVDGLALKWNIRNQEVQGRQIIKGLVKVVVSTDQEQIVTLGQVGGQLNVYVGLVRHEQVGQLEYSINDSGMVMDVLMHNEVIAITSRAHFHMINIGTKEVRSIRQNQTIMSLSYVGEKLITGSLQGQLCTWQKGRQEKSVLVSKSSINLVVNKNDKRIYLACKDGQVIMLDSNLKKTRVFQVDNMGINLVNKKIKSLDESQDGDLIIGLQGGQMVEIREQQNMRVIKHWHCKGQVRGIRLTGEDQEVVSGGDDKQLIVQNQFAVSQSKHFRSSITALELCQRDNSIVVGLDNGVIEWLSKSLLQKVHSLRNSHSSVEMIKYSPDERFLIVFDGTNISIYDPILKYVQIGRIRELQHYHSCLFQQDCLYVSLVRGKLEQLKVYDLKTWEKDKKRRGTLLEQSSHKDIREQLDYVDRGHEMNIMVGLPSQGSDTIHFLQERQVVAILNLHNPLRQILINQKHFYILNSHRLALIFSFKIGPPLQPPPSQAISILNQQLERLQTIYQPLTLQNQKSNKKIDNNHQLEWAIQSGCDVNNENLTEVCRLSEALDLVVNGKTVIYSVDSQIVVEVLEDIKQRVFRGHSHRITHINYSNNAVISSDSSNKILVWDPVLMTIQHIVQLQSEQFTQQILLQWPLMFIKQQNKFIVYDLVQKQTILQLNYQCILRHIEFLEESQSSLGIRLLQVFDHEMVIVKVHSANLQVTRVIPRKIIQYKNNQQVFLRSQQQLLFLEQQENQQKLFLVLFELDTGDEIARQDVFSQGGVSLHILDDIPYLLNENGKVQQLRASQQEIAFAKDCFNIERAKDCRIITISDYKLIFTHRNNLMQVDISVDRQQSKILQSFLPPQILSACVSIPKQEIIILTSKMIMIYSLLIRQTTNFFDLKDASHVVMLNSDSCVIAFEQKHLMVYNRQTMEKGVPIELEHEITLIKRLSNEVLLVITINQVIIVNFHNGNLVIYSKSQYTLPLKNDSLAFVFLVKENEYTLVTKQGQQFKMKIPGSVEKTNEKNVQINGLSNKYCLMQELTTSQSQQDKPKGLLVLVDQWNILSLSYEKQYPFIKPIEKFNKVQEININVHAIMVRLDNGLVVYNHNPPPQYILNNCMKVDEKIKKKEEEEKIKELEKNKEDVVQYNSRFIINEYNKTIKEPSGYFRELKEMKNKPKVKVEIEQIMGYSGNLQFLDEENILFSIDNYLVIQQLKNPQEKQQIFRQNSKINKISYYEKHNIILSVDEKECVLLNVNLQEVGRVWLKELMLDKSNEEMSVLKRGILMGKNTVILQTQSERNSRLVIVDIQTRLVRHSWIFPQEIIEIKWSQREQIVTVILTNYISIIDLNTLPAQCQQVVTKQNYTYTMAVSHQSDVIALTNCNSFVLVRNNKYYKEIKISSQMVNRNQTVTNNMTSVSKIDWSLDQQVTSLSSDGQNLVVGFGNVLVMLDKQFQRVIENVVEAMGNITCIDSLANKGIVIGDRENGVILQMSVKNVQEKKHIQVVQQVQGMGQVYSVGLSQSGVYVGTRESLQRYKLNKSSGQSNTDHLEIKSRQTLPQIPEMICLGCLPNGSSVVVERRGKVSFLDDKMEVKHILELGIPLDKPVLAVSPNGNMFALGNNRQVFIIGVRKEKKKIELEQEVVIQGGSVLSIDWSDKSDYLQIASLSQVMYFELSGRQFVQAFSEVRDAQWNSFSSSFGWAVQGLRQKYDTQLNLVQRTNNALSRSSTCFSISYHMVAVQVQNKGLQIHRFPMLSPISQAVDVPSLTSLNACIFSIDDKHLIVHNQHAIILYSITTI